MTEFYQNFCREYFDAEGHLTYFEPVYADNFNFAYDVVDAIANEEPGRRAMTWCNVEGEERTFTFAEIKYYSDKTAALLQSLGIGRGDAVMLVLKRHYEFWFAIIALHKLGAVAVPGTHLLTKKDFLYRFTSASVKGILCTGEGDAAQHVDAAEEEYTGLCCKLMVRGSRAGWLDFESAVEAAAPLSERVETAAHDPMLMYFTSGTTGYPKMVLHDFTYPIGHIITAKYWHKVIPDGLHLSVADTGWGKAVWGKLYGQWLMKAGIFVYDYEKFVPAELLRVIERHRVTTFCAPPTIFRFFIKEGLEHYDLSCLTHATIAGEALNPEVFMRFRELTGLSLMEGFGQTEMTLLIATLDGMTPKPGSMGKPTPLYDVDLIDEDGNTVPVGATGEIIVRKREHQVGLFMEYYRDAERTGESWRGGVYHTGDTAWRDEDGYFWYVGRTDDLIKSSGYRIGPFEIESVLMEHAAVLECAVTGVPDPVRGQIVKATVVLAKGYTASEELKKEIQEYVKSQTAPYKYPRIIDFVPELPKTISGKIRRVELREKKD